MSYFISIDILISKTLRTVGRQLFGATQRERNLFKSGSDQYVARGTEIEKISEGMTDKDILGLIEADVRMLSVYLPHDRYPPEEELAAMAKLILDYHNATILRNAKKGV